MLQGSWINQLGSTVVFIQREDGSLTGEYHTAVSRKNESLPGTPIHGSWQETSDGLLIGFVAQWKYVKDGVTKYSTTSWSGKLSDDKIKTNWLLTSADQPEWNNTNIGQDTFTRN